MAGEEVEKIIRIDWALQQPVKIDNRSEWKLPQIHVTKTTVLILLILAISAVATVHGATAHPNDPSIWPTWSGSGGGRAMWHI